MRLPEIGEIWTADYNDGTITFKVNKIDKDLDLVICKGPIVELTGLYIDEYSIGDITTEFIDLDDLEYNYMSFSKKHDTPLYKVMNGNTNEI